MSRSRCKRIPTIAILALAVATVWCGAQPAVAQDGEFVDGFATSGNQTRIVFGSGELPPIPADFFFPGSQPFSGSVGLSGLALDESGADTRVQRRGDPEFHNGQSASVAAWFVSLTLSSNAPIVVESADGTYEEWLLGIGLSRAPQPVGSFQARLTSPAGGSFNASLPLLPQISFARLADIEAAGDGTIDPSEITVRFLDFADWGFPPIEFLFEGFPFSTVPLKGNPSNGSRFFPGVLPGGVGTTVISNREPAIPVFHLFEIPPKIKRCKYDLRSVTVSTNPVCRPKCKDNPQNIKGIRCNQKADCPQWRVVSQACATQGSCVALYEIIDCVQC